MVTQISLSSELIVMIAGAFLSAMFTYIPKFNVWFAMKSDEVKQLTMLILMFVVSVVIFILGCNDLIPIENFICDKHTVWYFIYTFFIAAMSNQSTDRILPKPLAVRQAREIVQTDELAKKFF